MGSQENGCALLLPLLLSLAAPSVAQTPAGEFRGRVIDERGEPLAGVAVGAYAMNSFVDTNKLLASAQVVTGEDGTYSLHVDEPDRSLLMLACKGRQACRLQLSGTAAIADTLLAPGGQLVGRVRDESGGGIAGARVSVESAAFDAWMPKKRVVSGALSNDQGIFVAPCLPRAGLRVKVEADGYRSVAQLTSQGSPLDVRLVRASLARGRVIDKQGRAMAGLQISVVTISSHRTPSSATSGADGQFAISVPPKGPYRIAAFEGAPPHRRFSSAVLRGCPENVVVRRWDARTPKLLTEVRVVDRESKQAIESFRLAPVRTDLTKLQRVVHQSRPQLQPYEHKAEVFAENERDNVRGVLVEADGYAFAAAALPEKQGETLVVELGPEAVLTGIVVDAETGKPMAGAAVRALPTGTMRGSGGRAEEAGPRTNERGEFRVAGLRPGDYGVQVHVADRPASKVRITTLAEGDNPPLQLQAPKRIWVTIDVEGPVPPGPPPQLQVFASNVWSAQERGRFDHRVAPPPAVSLAKPGRLRIGPIGRKKAIAQIFVPSRTRTATGTTLALGDVTDGFTIRLPDLKSVLVRGRIEPSQKSQKLPTERVAVVANPKSDRRDRRFGLGKLRPCLAGVRGDGSFEMDVPAGVYTFQLADIVTGIIFHTEAEDMEVGDAPLVIAPQVRWLEVAMVPTIEGGDVHLMSLGLELERPRDGEHAALLRQGMRRNNREVGWSRYYDGETTQRWLVPAGEIQITAKWGYDKLIPWSSGWSSEEVDATTINVSGPSQRVELRIPPLPSDEELMQRK
ncbi:MAG: carboxypeptidase-like regulatory domain-containing protein [Planctomycetota bacterium]